jgi:hypothetical protein
MPDGVSIADIKANCRRASLAGAAILSKSNGIATQPLNHHRLL